MRHFHFVILAGCFLFSCNKFPADTPDPIDPVINPVQTALMAHTWLYDSVKTDEPGSPTTVQAEPKIEVTFNLSKYNAFTPAANPQNSEFRYEYEEPAKIYHWIEENGKDTSEFFNLVAVTDESLVLSYPFYDHTALEYYHAK